MNHTLLNIYEIWPSTYAKQFLNIRNNEYKNNCRMLNLGKPEVGGELA